MKPVVLLSLCLTACATGAPFRALEAEAHLPRRTVSFHPLGSDEPLARSAGQWALYRERVGLQTRFVTLTLQAEAEGWSVRLRRDSPKGHEERSIDLLLTAPVLEDPFLRALKRASQFQAGGPQRVVTKAGVFEQARDRGGLRFHPRVPVFGLVQGGRGLYRIELISFGLHPAPKP
ncbi:MAG: hypothetical protein CMH55_07290 [Myxococcales bacterium]|nr:hypothetical protein [Myxococcales bacterium]